MNVKVHLFVVDSWKFYPLLNIWQNGYWYIPDFSFYQLSLHHLLVLYTVTSISLISKSFRLFLKQTKLADYHKTYFYKFGHMEMFVFYFYSIHLSI